jgi:hypothetical protein
MLQKPFSAILEAGVTALIGKDQQVDQNDYGASVAITLGIASRTDEPVSGEILSFAFYSTEEGSGSVQTPAGYLLLFDANPAISAGDTAITAAEHRTILGIVEVEADDWVLSDANGATAYIHDCPVAFHDLSTLYAAWFHNDATSHNDAAGDDERLDFNFWYRRDS